MVFDDSSALNRRHVLKITVDRLEVAPVHAVITHRHRLQWDHHRHRLNPTQCDADTLANPCPRSGDHVVTGPLVLAFLPVRSYTQMAEAGAFEGFRLSRRDAVAAQKVSIIARSASQELL